jgi:hypothetical protein
MPLGTYAVHVRRSDDGGNTWSANDLLTIPSATTVGLAVNEHGHVAMLYQQVTGTSGSQPWEIMPSTRLTKGITGMTCCWPPYRQIHRRRPSAPILGLRDDGLQR